MTDRLTTSPATVGYDDPQPRMAFFTDTTVCIGCKACEVACKEWNDVPAGEMALTGFSYDNTVGLDADNWRAVHFIEQRIPQIRRDGEAGLFVDGELDITRADGDGRVASVDSASDQGFRWLMSSDVCKHCTTAACLDVCPTGALFKTEFATVVLQDDICNGCGYCVPACPYGVVDRRSDDGGAYKCTMCYDRLKGGMEPACAQSCPTDSILFGTYEDMRAAAAERLDEVVEAGYVGAQLYGADEANGVDGCGAFFLLLDDPEVYGLPPDPIAATKFLPGVWRAVGAAALGMGAVIVGAVVAGRRA
ncbi:4Fe-4S dicluster domain-containing protein [Euzebya sp.]|uniref:4Fe-4S dicluster domain-containing protein n=1 Tax=Euzebya sp. TaxID=1971409 RepID=UPI0035182AFC